VTDPILPASTTVPTAPVVPASGDPASGMTGVVNVAPSQASPLLTQIPSAAPQGSPNTPDVSALLANQEQRVRDLMSQKDRAINERNQVISQYTALQNQYAELQQQSSTALAAAADTNHQAITQVQQLQAENAQLKGHLQRSQALEQHPELLPYKEFVPVTGTPEEQLAAITKLQEIRQQDMQRISSQQQPFFQQSFATPGIPGASGQTPVPIPAPSPDMSSLATFQALYGHRSTIPPFMASQPGSTPATMSPAGAASTVDSIDQMMKEAMATGDSVAFEKARQQAIQLANQTVNQQLGR